MHDNINNTPKDHFSETIRKKIEHHSSSVDASSWDAIQAGLKIQKKKKAIPFWWITSGAAAVVLLMLSLQFFNNSIPTQQQLAINNAIESETIEIESKIREQEEFITKNNQTINSDNNLINTSKNKTLFAKNEAKVLKTDEPTLNKTDKKNQSTEIANSHDSHLDNTKIAEKEKTSKIHKHNIELTQNDKVANWEDPLEETKKRKWSALAAVSSAHGIENFNNSSVSSAQFASLVRAPAERTNATILAPSDFAERTYHAPLSFGFYAAKKVNDRFSIETGIVYTFLRTDFEDANSSQPDISARLNLHYLGLPLNVNVQLWKNNKWSIYYSAGGMIEKGLQSVFNQEQDYGNQIINTNAKTKIKGFQWSINTAAGFTYNIYRDFDLYFEPKASYYFDNDQPVSIRTKNNIALGIEAGLRFKF